MEAPARRGEPTLITAGTLDPAGAPPHAAPGELIASVDVEWTKNYHVKNGNVPFCVSVVYLRIPTDGTPVSLSGVPWWWSSAYVETSDETVDLVRVAADHLHAAHQAGARLVGHQLSSDLGVLLAAADREAPAILAAQQRWRARRTEPGPLDTRYDAGHLLPGVTSRRLVDVCTALRLDVTQPELLRTSMTARHRRWLVSGAPDDREQVSVLNLRHSLSTALVAALALGVAPSPSTTLNVNRLLADGLGGHFDYISSPTFAELL